MKIMVILFVFYSGLGFCFNLVVLWLDAKKFMCLLGRVYEVMDEDMGWADVGRGEDEGSVRFFYW